MRQEIDGRKEWGLWFRRTAPALAVALLFLVSAARDRVTQKLPATGGVDSLLPMPGDDGGLFVEFGDVRVPLLTFEGNVCPLEIPDGVIIYCSRLALLDGGTKNVGAIYAGHNVHYTSPYNPEEWLQVTRDDPGGLAIINQRKCVKFGRSWLTIGQFAVRNKNDAWWLDWGSRFITSITKTTTDPNPNYLVYSAPLNPCDEPSVVSVPWGTTPTPTTVDDMLKTDQRRHKYW